ncbi:MAG: hypothetical protein ACLFVE_08840, partial [Chitinispirillaceae bacterium]
MYKLFTGLSNCDWRIRNEPMQYPERGKGDFQKLMPPSISQDMPFDLLRTCPSTPGTGSLLPLSGITAGSMSG